MPRVLLLAATTGYQTRAFDEAAERLGIDLVFATDRCHVLDDPWRDRAVPVHFGDDAASAVAILEALGPRAVNGVLAVGDRPTAIAAHVSAALGLPWHSPDAALAARNKLSTRERLRDAGLRVPWFVPTSISGDVKRLASSIAYPAVVKPVALSGSRGVMRVNGQAELVAAFYRLRALLQSPDIRSERNPAHDTAIVEGFIPGRELAVEGLMTGGALQVLAIFDKPDPLNGPFFEETIYVTPSATATCAQEAIVDAVARAAAAIGLTHGPVHAECRVNDEGVYVLEVAARPIGGLCARALRFQKMQNGVGYDFSNCSLEELLLRHAVGEPSQVWTREPQASGVMMIPIPRRGVLRGVSGIDEARQIPGIDDVRITAKADQILVPLPEGASYLGFLFARSASPDAATRALRDAHACLHFSIDPEVPMLQSLHG